MLLTHEKTLSLLGFRSLFDVRGRLSVADLYRDKSQRTGIYLLGFTDGTFYIGQALDVCRRFADHCRDVGHICFIAFLPRTPDVLNDFERDTIYRAEQAGLPITNRVHVSAILGQTDLDDVVSETEQKLWLERWPKPLSCGKTCVALPSDSPQRIRTDHAWQRLHQRSDWTIIRTCLSRYISSCVPYPAQTQYTFWSLSCLPATGKGRWPRCAVVNAGLMELLVLGKMQQGSGTWAFVNVAASKLEEKYGSIALALRAFPGVEARQTSYRSAGSDHIQLHADSIMVMNNLLRSPAVCDAAGLLMIRQMRSRATIFSRFHCPSLADAVLSGSEFQNANL
jgi:hypothetical protein